MKAVILVGGFGTRLRPLTLTAPKQMLPVVGVTMLERVVAKLASQGVTEVVLSLGYKPDVFSEAFPDGRCAGIKMHYAVEPEPLDTAGAIRFAADDAGIAERFVALNGDVLTDLDLAALWKQHETAGAEGTIALTPVEDPSRYGVVPLDADGRVEAFIEKPDPGTAPTNWINAGTYILEPSVLGRIQTGRKVSIEREVFPEMATEGSLYGLQSDTYWIDAGTPEAYLQAHMDLIDGVRGGTETAVHPEARVHANATIQRSVVGAGAEIGNGCKINDSIVMDGATVADGCSLDRSILGAGAVLGSSSRLSGLSILGYAARAEDGTVLDAGAIPAPDTWPPK